MSLRRILAYGLPATLVAALLAAASPSAFSLLDLRTGDLMLRASNRHDPSVAIAIAAIDERSLAEVGQWPWPRDTLARLIDAIRGLGARVVAIDVLLAEPDRFERPTDSAFAAVVARGGVVVSYAFIFDQGAKRADDCILHPVRPAVIDSRDGRSPVDQLFHATGVVCSLPGFSRAAGSSGFLNATPDRDGLLRRIPLLIEFEGAVYPSLALAAVKKAREFDRLTLVGLAGERARIDAGGQQVPLDARGTLLVRFRGGPGSYGQVPATDILNGRVPPGALRDRIVFVGATALGIQDIVSTPAGTAMPGIEVHAAAADTLLRGDFVATPHYWRAYELGATIGLSLLVVVAVARIGLLLGAIASTLALIGLWAGTFMIVTRAGVYLAPVFPTAGMGLVLLTLTIAAVRYEHRRADSERSRRERAHQFAVHSLTSLMESRDGATGQHARRTQQYSRLLATRLAVVPRFRSELTPERIELIAQLSPLHDIGKVGVRDAVLYKPGALSNEELDEIRRHPVFGHDTLAVAGRRAGVEGDEELLQLAKDIVYTHHERWDGRGYPRGVKGDHIPLAGRIMAVVDVYDALSTARSYRSRLTHEEAVSTIVAGRGTHFDPDIVDAFLAIAEEFRGLAQAISDP
jgi:adenylate cyclase